MSAKLFVLVLAVTISAAFAANVCKIGNVVNGKANAQPYYFPANWNETESAPHLAAGQSCSWVVTMPLGYYAKIIMSGRINDSVGHFQTVDGNGNVIMTQHENKEPYYFPSPKFTLIVSNQAPATFAFKIVWAPFPTQVAYTAVIDNKPYVVNITKDVFAADYSAPGLSLLAFPADPRKPHTLRSVMIFQGKDYTGTYVTTLSQVYSRNTQYISPTGLIYIVNVEASNVLDQLLIQDAEHTSIINPYKELSCEKSATQCSKFLNAGPNQISGLVYAGLQNQTLTSITLDPTATLSVYYGEINYTYFYRDYNASTIQSQLPITFKGGYVTQYIVSSGKTTFTFSFSG